MNSWNKINPEDCFHYILHFTIPQEEPRKLSAIKQIISKRIALATCAVIWFGASLVGIRQTTSPPMIFLPRIPCSSFNTSGIMKPSIAGSRLATPGATAESRQSRSKVIYSGLSPTRSRIISRQRSTPYSSYCSLVITSYPNS